MLNRFAGWGRCLALVGLVFGCTSVTLAANATKSVVGTIEKVDAEAKVVYVKTKDGAVRAFKWSRSTTSHGIKAAEIWSKTAVHKGAHVVIRSVEVAGEDTIKGIHWFGQVSVKVADATIHYVEKNGKTIAITIEGEAKKFYNVSSHAVIQTGTEAVHGFKEFAHRVGTESKGGVHIIEKDGKTFISHIEHPKQ